MIMRLSPRRRSLGLALFVALGALSGGALAGAQPAPAPSTPPAAAPEGKVLEEKAIELLRASSRRLAAAKTMTFTAVVSYESPSRPGPALVYTTRSDVTVQRPNKLRVITPGDGPASEFYYDGKTVTAFAPKENLAAVADAPPTLDAMLREAYHYAAIYFPFTDVIVSDPHESIAKSLELAFYIGQSRVVAGTTTEMIAYAAHGVFIQLWIGADDKLPRMARAVFRNDPLRLRHQVEFSNWKLDPEIPAGTFASARAAQAKRIPFEHPDPAPVPATPTPVPSQPSGSK